MADDLRSSDSSRMQPFSVARLRSGIYLFAAGKLIAGLIGLVWLLVLVRALDVPAYAGYVILIALLEILLLASNGGVYAFAQRYVTEGRLPGNIHLLQRLVWASLTYRMLTLLLCVAAVAIGADYLAGWLSQPLLAKILPLYGLVIFSEGAVRYLELVFESLLEQGLAQFCTVFRNGIRLIAVGLLWQFGGTVDLVDVVLIEAGGSGLSLLLGMLLMWRLLSKNCRLHDGQRAPGMISNFSAKRFVKFVVPVYFAQCATQLYSPDTIKLIVSRLLGAAEAAAFGFAHAISFILQRYLPAGLLLGLIRPMLVARQHHADGVDQLSAVGNLILKINLLLLLPAAAVFAVAGADFAGWVSGGRYQSAGLVLFLLTLLLILNGMHLVLAMMATTLENGRAVLWGTVISMPGVAVGMVLAPRLGSIAMVLGLWASELLWCGFTLNLLRRSGFGFRIDLAAWLKLVAAAAVAAAVAWCLLFAMQLHGRFSVLTAVFVILPIYAIVGLLMKPFTSAESQLVRRLLPARFREARLG